MADDSDCDCDFDCDCCYDSDCDCDCCGDCDCDFCCCGGCCCTGGDSDSGSFLNNFAFYLCIDTDTRDKKKKNDGDSCCCWCCDYTEKRRKESKSAPQKKEDKKKEELSKERKDAQNCPIHGSNNVPNNGCSYHCSLDPPPIQHFETLDREKYIH